MTPQCICTSKQYAIHNINSILIFNSNKYKMESIRNLRAKDSINIIKI